MRAPLRGLVAAVAVALAAAAVPAASADQPDLNGVRRATAPFHNLRLAEAAGYADSGLPCFDDPTGGMGFHWVKGPLTDAPKADAPDALVYAPRPDGSLQLVAVEYLVDVGSWGSSPPQLFGQQFHELSLPQFGLHVWELHAWIWKPNPSGMFTDFNPSSARCS